MFHGPLLALTLGLVVVVGLRMNILIFFHFISFISSISFVLGRLYGTFGDFFFFFFSQGPTQFVIGERVDGSRQGV